MTTGKLPYVSQTQTEWVIGWKAATPYIRDNNELVFMPLVCRNIPYVVNDIAVCRQYGHAQPPGDYCRCGFNAWHDTDQALRYVRTESRPPPTTAYHGNHKMPVPSINETLVILRVGLHGDIVDMREPAWGYRAERQRVVDMFVNNACATCSRDAVTLGVMNTVYPQSPNERTVPSYLIWPLCDHHVYLSRRIIDSRDIAAHNNVKIHWGYPTSD